MNTSRVPAGVPTGGQFAASAHTESGVALPPGGSLAADPLAALRNEALDLERRWRDEADLARVFNGLIATLGKRVLAASAPDRPGYADLADATGRLGHDITDDDLAEEVLFCLDDITATPPRSR